LFKSTTGLLRANKRILGGQAVSEEHRVKRLKRLKKKRRKHAPTKLRRTPTNTIAATPITLTNADDTFMALAHWMIGHNSGETLAEWKERLVREHPDFIAREIQWWISAGLTLREYVENNPGTDEFLVYLAALAFSVGAADTIDPRVTPELRDALMEQHEVIEATNQSAEQYLRKWMARWREAQSNV
jgi:predicted thioredoxin/glutaredoxin